MPTEMENLATAAKAKAAEFTADPAKGYAAGYQPEHRYRRSPPEVGFPGQVSKVRADSTAWLYAVAARDLAGWQWRVDEGMGGMDDLVVIGRRY
jgi:hypothetical protein